MANSELCVAEGQEGQQEELRRGGAGGRGGDPELAHRLQRLRLGMNTLLPSPRLKDYHPTNLLCVLLDYFSNAYKVDIIKGFKLIEISFKVITSEISIFSDYSKFKLWKTMHLLNNVEC